nr:DUF2271 domain-containing protein [Polaribacter sp. SA4-12]
MAFSSLKKSEASQKYKCMIQMKNYEGEGAYIIISLVNPKGEYEKTLYVQGDDEKWYHDIKEWWNFQSKVDESIDAITGATISGGNRTISIIEIPNDKLNKGYKIRFESAVEQQKHYSDDVEFGLTTETVDSKVDGKGFIRYIRILPQ